MCSFNLFFCFRLLWDRRKSLKFFSKVKVIVSICINLTLIQDYPESSENSVNHCNPFPFGDNHMLNLTIISLELISYVIQITITFLCCFIFWQLLPASRFNTCMKGSLHSRRLEVVGTWKNGRARRRHARGEGPRVSPSHAPVLSFAHYFKAPATQAIWREDFEHA